MAAEGTQNFKSNLHFFIYLYFSLRRGIAEHDMILPAICGYCMQSDLKGNQITFATGPKVIFKKELHEVHYL